MLCARNPDLLQEAQADLIKLATVDQKIIAKATDVSVEADVKALVNETLEKLGNLRLVALALQYP